MTASADHLRTTALRSIGLHDKLADCHPSLRRGQVWCRKCRRTELVDSAECFRSGWPKCCGYTMTIDALASLQDRVDRLEGWVEDAYLEGYSRGMTAGSLVCREEDWAESKARAALQTKPDAKVEDS
jgi:hypothetical protein